MKDLEKMLMGAPDEQNSGDSEMNPKEMQAKLDVLQEILSMAQELMGNKLKGEMDGMQKVTVAAPDKAGLQEGLQKAGDVVDKADPMIEKIEEATGEDVDHDNEEGESPEHKAKIAEAAAQEDNSDAEEMKKPKKRKLFSMLDDNE